MATATRRPLPTLKIKKLPPPRLPSPEKPTTNAKKNGRNLDPLEKRLINIRLHLLHNTTRRAQTPSEPTLVFDSFLYLGGLKSLSNKVNFIFLFIIPLCFFFIHQLRLTRLKITHILSVVFIPPSRNLIAPHMKHLFIKADDNVAFNMTPYFEQACQFIEEARQSKGCVLVHCVCGVSRSTTLCCAYLMKHHSMTVEQALVQLRSRRHIIQPNNGFLRQLVIYNEQLQIEQADRDKAAVNTIIGQLENI
jgi:protein-tyrosine phosphatase